MQEKTMNLDIQNCSTIITQLLQIFSESLVCSFRALAAKSIAESSNDNLGILSS